MTITPINASMNPIVKPMMPLTITFQLNAVINEIITTTPPMPPIRPADSKAATNIVVASHPYIMCGNVAIKSMRVEIIFDFSTFFKIMRYADIYEIGMMA